jgi:hypothetical protein
MALFAFCMTLAERVGYGVITLLGTVPDQRPGVLGAARGGCPKHIP